MVSRRLGLIALLALLLAGPALAQTGFELELDRIRRATVFIYQTRSIGDDHVIACVSAGTLISADGLIITNAHGVVAGEQCDGDSLIVALNVDLTEPPIPKYRAEIARADSGLDVALLRITRELDGRLIAQGGLPILPFVNIGDSELVAIDDNLIVAGYPDLGNRPVAIARGTVIAFIAEPVARGPSWFKTRAEIPGTMSGGGAYNSVGELIGIPTSAPLSGPVGAANCRFIDDTNRDGLINSSDSCIPTGDFISTIRPIGLAQSLIRGARLGLDIDLPPNEPGAPPLNPPAVSRLFFAPSLQGDMPATVVGSMPANTRSLYLFFDYDNMTAETVYEMRVTLDGAPNTVFSLPPVRWSGGRRGLWHIGGREQAWANGAYEFTLLINGANAGSQQILVGGGAANTGHFSDIVFGTLDRSGALVGNGLILPLGSIAYARFLYANMSAGTRWSAIWHYAGAEVARTTDTWNADRHGATVISLAPANGLLPGLYRLELYIEGALSATSDFVVAGQQGAPLPDLFRNLRYSSAESPAAARTAQAASSFPASVNALHALFDWQQIAVGTPWTLRWLVDDQAFFQATRPWTRADTGSDFTVSIASPPEGNYRLQLLVNNLLLVEAAATVGIGQLPIDRLAELQGLILSGRVLDAANGSGIPSVTIVLIGEAYAAAEFEWTQEQVVALATSDRNGDFQFDRPLAFETPYSVVIEADGYIPLAADQFLFSADQPYVNITIELVRG